MLEKSVHLAHCNIHLALPFCLGRCTKITTDECKDFLFINIVEPLIKQGKLTLPGSTAAGTREAQSPLANISD